MSTVKEVLFEQVNSGNIDEAYELIESNLHNEINNLKDDPRYCVLAASAYLEKENLTRAFDLISLGLLSDNHNYELYLMLGEYYGRSNLNQALLCFYQAMLYCDVEDDAKVIESYIKDVVDQGASIRQISIVVVAHNQSEQLKECLDSIVSTVMPGMYEIVIVDNGSSDDTGEWVSEIDGISYWHENEVLGYAQAANQGIRLSGPFNDVFLLDADCVLADNSMFYLMLGLYSDNKVGAIGGITNDYVNDQKMFIDTQNMVEAQKIVATVNSPMRDAYERAIYISDYAILIRRDAIEKVGMLDEEFLGDTYEDKDLCVRINYAGLSVLLCYNSYIFKFFNRHAIYGDNEVENENKKAFLKKWGFSIDYSNTARDGLIEMIKAENDKPIEVLELGCAMGSTLHRIKRLWSNANVYGIEYDKAVARVAEKMGNIIQGDVESMEIPYDKKQFDYIICADVLEHLRNPQDALNRFIPYLKDDGYMIISLPNIRHYAVFMMLALLGRFDYASDGILDSTHLKFFTRDTAKEMIEGTGLRVVDIKRNYNGHPEDNDYIDKLKMAFDVLDPEELKVFQYYFLAKK